MDRQGERKTKWQKGGEETGWPTVKDEEIIIRGERQTDRNRQTNEGRHSRGSDKGGQHKRERRKESERQGETVKERERQEKTHITSQKRNRGRGKDEEREKQWAQERRKNSWQEERTQGKWKTKEKEAFPHTTSTQGNRDCTHRFIT